ncbi:Lactose transport system permease protein LacF [Microbacterium lemovicicum]|uniref:Lactose transport system permease protein LacF n=1 Tax=Microbacterium lemovicicum TaxID=1072463 RepID=A0A3Q9J098_9MICO|nr:sugar ABC transporter permease [Microbacterium lemovicicum]AZS38253.1 Lactose transport system permease protein LacF [Microbacterium lemovicicum]
MTVTEPAISAGAVPPPYTSASRPRRRRPAGTSRGAAWVFLSPWVIGAALLTIGPMVASLILSFTDYDLFTQPQFVGFDNYQRMFSEDPRFWKAVGVTLNYVLVAVPLKLAIALGIALLLNRPRRGQGFYRSAFYAPSLLGASVAVAIVWRTLYSNDGVVDNTLNVVGLDIGGWISNPSLALYVLVSLAVWQFGAPMVIFLAGLKQVPAELYDAAAVDGAGRWRSFWSVTWPLLSPVLFFNLVLEMIGAFQSFTSAYVVSGGRGGPIDSTLFYTLYLYDRAFTAFDMGYASAMAWFLLIVIAIVTALIFRSSRGWVHYVGEEK